jgi:hypothetical protein
LGRTNNADTIDGGEVMISTVEVISQIMSWKVEVRTVYQETKVTTS